MSQENLELAQMSLDAFNRRDRAAWMALMDPDVEAVPPPNWPESEPIRGSGAVWTFYVQNIEAFREGVLENAELIDAGDKGVVAQMRGKMHGRASDASVSFSYWPVSTIRDHKVVRMEWFADRAEALKAVGLSG